MVAVYVCEKSYPILPHPLSCPGTAAQARGGSSSTLTRAGCSTAVCTPWLYTKPLQRHNPCVDQGQRSVCTLIEGNVAIYKDKFRKVTKNSNLAHEHYVGM